MPAVASIMVGSARRITANFKNTAGTDTDPTAITCRVRNPVTRAWTSYVFGTDAEVVKDSTGNYHLILSLSVAGEWMYRWEGTGTIEQADEKRILVEDSEYSA